MFHLYSISMQKTFTKYLFDFGCRVPISQIDSKILTSVNQYQLLFNESYNRHIHLLLNTSLYAQNSETKNQKPPISGKNTQYLSQWWTDYRKRITYKERCVNKIMSCLQCSKLEASYLVDSDQLTFLDKIDITLESIQYLLEQGMSSESIRTNVHVFHLTLQDLKLRISYLHKWDIDKKYHNDFLPVFKLGISDFLMISNQFIKEKQKGIPDGNRVIHFAKILNCSVMELNRRMVRCKVLYRYDFDQLKSSMRCFQKYNVKTECILKDISALKFEEEIIDLRLSLPFKKGLSPLRPALVSYTNAQYLKRLKELEQQMNYYSPYKNRDEYLAAKLFTDKILFSAQKKRKIITFFELIDTQRLISVMEFLLEKKFTQDQICTNLPIFYTNVDLLKERYDAAVKAGIRSPTLKLLTRNPDSFEEYLKRTEFNLKQKNYLLSEMAPLVIHDNAASETDTKI